MNHDYAHCLDYDSKCPADCFRAQLTTELKAEPFRRPVAAWQHFRGGEECPLPLIVHADYRVSPDCKNPDSFGEICVHCGQCGRQFGTKPVHEV